MANRFSKALVTVWDEKDDVLAEVKYSQNAAKYVSENADDVAAHFLATIDGADCVLVSCKYAGKKNTFEQWWIYADGTREQETFANGISFTENAWN